MMSPPKAGCGATKQQLKKLVNKRIKNRSENFNAIISLVIFLAELAWQCLLKKSKKLVLLYM